MYSELLSSQTELLAIRDRSFSFFNDRFVMKTTTKRHKRNDRFLFEIIFKNGRVQNDRFKKLLVSLTIVKDKPL